MESSGRAWSAEVAAMAGLSAAADMRAVAPRAARDRSARGFALVMMMSSGDVVSVSADGPAAWVAETDPAVEPAGRVDVDEAHVSRAGVDDRVGRVAGDEHERAGPGLYLVGVLAE